MMTNREAKRAVTLKAWTDQVMECQASGMTVRAWCRSKGIAVNTYHYRKTQVRKAACRELEKQENKIPVFAELKPVEKQSSLSCSTSNIAVTLSIGTNLLAVHNGADEDTVSAVLRMVSNL